MAEYKIVSYETPDDTEAEVNALLSQGWRLHGDLKVIGNAYIQAMIQYGDYEGDNSISVYLPNIDQNDIEYAIKSIAEALEEGLTNVAKALAYKE